MNPITTRFFIYPRENDIQRLFSRPNPQKKRNAHQPAVAFAFAIPWCVFCRAPTATSTYHYDRWPSDVRARDHSRALAAQPHLEAPLFVSRRWAFAVGYLCVRRIGVVSVRSASIYTQSRWGTHESAHVVRTVCSLYLYVTRFAIIAKVLYSMMVAAPHKGRAKTVTRREPPR